VKKKKLKPEAGILSLDFIFSLTAVYAVSLVFCLLSLTLMFSSVAQYVTFSIARAHSSGDIDLNAQQEAGVFQKEKILGSYLGRFLRENEGGWFRFVTTGLSQEHTAYDWSGSVGGARQSPYGVGARFTSNLIRDFRVPLLGSPGDGADDDFGSADVYSFLYREPSTEECLNFNRTRFEVILERFPDLSSMPDFVNSGDIGAEADNGC
jgi:hypothetical protein